MIPNDPAPVFPMLLDFPLVFSAGRRVCVPTCQRLGSRPLTRAKGASVYEKTEE